MRERFEDLIGDVGPSEEHDRLRRVHELLLAVEAPPQLSPVSADTVEVEPVRALLPRRRAILLLAAALGAASFGTGYLLGARDDDVDAVRTISMSGVGETRGASASIELLPEDEAGNWPMLVLVRGLEPSRDRADYYELWLTRNGKLAATCGRFTLHAGLTTVSLSVPYRLRSYDAWVVTRAGSDEVLLTT